MPFSLAIIGAGPAGLTLARLLQVASVDISITIFEKDTSRTSRFMQGGTLDLHTDTGLAALKKAGLWEEALKHLRYEGEELFIADKNDTVIIHLKDQPKVKSRESKLDYERPEIDREVLKDMLLDSVDSDWVKWGKTLQSIDPETGILSFRDGSTAGPFDLVVGADGAWSKVRHVLTDVRPHYSGICGFEGRIPNPDEQHPKLSKMVGKGSYFSYSDGKSLNAQRMSDRSIKTAYYVKMEDNESWATDLLAAYGDNEDKLKEKILENYQDWTRQQKELVRVSTNFHARALYELPVGHTWVHKKGYTLIGDAASLMTPFAGEGVNKAMKDSLELAEALEKALKEQSNMDEAVRQYEENMFPRAKRIQRHTMSNKEGMFSREGPVMFLTAMVDGAAEEMGKDLTKGWLAWIPIKTLLHSYVVTVQTFGAWRRRVKDWFSRE
ncbi:uncharacterized protein Z520_10134 [Fonsecaea multimorphosa CBS 102226]|uniref:FAD-binding domain-containing protein n=1 Tax=Fonsecaea multimorphosa CBS 102226 TaxID=1442371 RepID=A0A0D2KBQ5_9EURO|nr:uncharacterized protein Z520_10134 [Fonsecaea multimorphosa CBS 102226]KIX94108.1 hypothetical protein Z520_10134 [Fonsecaea multimorphosa CBS 102226]OAL19461.1 hypothetical protein AYO22_09623 [Fonsecaea multimorphosa]